MATSYKTPGVYIKEIPSFPPSIAAVETAIPVFIGHTEKAEKGEDVTNKAVKISSLLEYESYFGKPQKEENIVVAFNEYEDSSIPDTIVANFAPMAEDDPTPNRSKHIMYYCIQSFYNNGGGDCYIISVGGYNETFGATVSAGDFSTALAELEKEDEPTLIVFPEGQGMEISEYYGLQNSALNICAKMQDRFSIIDVHHTGEGLQAKSDIETAITAMRNGITSDSIRYGAAYFPNIQFSFDYSFDEAEVTVNTITHALDGTTSESSSTLTALKTSNGPLYAKALQAVRNLPVTLPPSSTMAGLYADVDSKRGVWKAPANVGVVGAVKLTCKITNDIQEGLNVTTSGKSVNAIRAFEGGRGILVWGSRTLDGNSNEWRYVPVRRFFNFAEESIKKGTERFVFEPNDANTWVMVRSMIENFLTLQWRAGALAGAVPEHAFYVSVGLGETMTPLDILEGRMNVEIGMAVVRPAEFIILKFSHKMQES